LYRAFNPSSSDISLVEYLDPEYTPVTLTTYPESLYDFCAIIDSPQVVSGDTNIYFYSNCNEPPPSNAPCAWSDFGVINSELPGGPRSFTYTDCDGNTQSVTLQEGESANYCGCASSFSSIDGGGYILTSPPNYDICPLGTIGFDDRYTSLYANYLVRSLRDNTTFPFSYINFNGDTVNVTLQPNAILELTGVKVGSLLSANTSWLVTYQGAYVPPVLYKIQYTNCTTGQSGFCNSPVDMPGMYSYTFTLPDGSCCYNENNYGPTDNYSLPTVVNYWNDGASCNCNQ
jgi:hypothetical protein